LNTLVRKIKVILVEPSGSINLGSIARLCKNFEVSELRLVNPKCDPSNAESQRMAVKGRKLLEESKIYSSLTDAIADCSLVVATAGRIDHGEIPILSPQFLLNWLNRIDPEISIGLIFGREDNGLTNQELLLANKVLTISTSSNYPSLNISHAVAIALHELTKSEGGSSSIKKHTSANPSDINSCLLDMEDLLLSVGFLLKHTAKAKMKKIRTFIHRAEVNTQEISLIRGMINQIKWAINNEKKSKISN
tara:strand:- start:1722 stop:2468 length:747 start_codon:yes stop_codon:yes gene_type:complete